MLLNQDSDILLFNPWNPHVYTSYFVLRSTMRVSYLQIRLIKLIINELCLASNAYSVFQTYGSPCFLNHFLWYTVSWGFIPSIYFNKVIVIFFKWCCSKQSRAKIWKNQLVSANCFTPCKKIIFPYLADRFIIKADHRSKPK